MCTMDSKAASEADKPAVLEVWLVDMLQDDVSNTLSVVESLFAIDKYTSSSESSAKTQNEINQVIKAKQINT